MIRLVRGVSLASMGEVGENRFCEAFALSKAVRAYNIPDRRSYMIVTFFLA